MDYGIELEHEPTYDTASAVINDSRAVSAPAIGIRTADELRNRQTEAKEELADAIDNADLERMTALRVEIKSLPEQITIADMRELKLRLKQIELEREKNAESIKLINQVRRQKHSALVEKIKELEPYQKAVVEWDFKLSLANNDAVLLQIETREKKAKLFSLSEAMRNETD